MVKHKRIKLDLYSSTVIESKLTLNLLNVIPKPVDLLKEVVGIGLANSFLNSIPKHKQKIKMQGWDVP